MTRKKKSQSTIMCPICHQELDLVATADDPNRKVAYCNCRGGEAQVAQVYVQPVLVAEPQISEDSEEENNL